MIFCIVYPHMLCYATNNLCGQVPAQIHIYLLIFCGHLVCPRRTGHLAGGATRGKLAPNGEIFISIIYIIQYFRLNCNDCSENFAK